MRLLGGVALIVAGVLLRVPVIAIFGLVLTVLEITHALWVRRGIRGIEYRRTLDRDRISWGEEVGLTVDAWNRGRLPLSWLRADDATSEGVVVRGRDVVDSEEQGPALRNTWTLGPF